MKTLYEILEVSENASAEVIEKAYKVLAKRYHPDLQAPEDKAKAEKKMKEINEAYEILGDEAKRKEYDNKLSLERQAEKERNKLKEEANAQYNKNNINEQQSYQNYGQPYYNGQNHTYNDYQKPINNNTDYEENLRQREEAFKNQQKMQEEMQKNMQEQYEQRYQQAYEDYLRSLGYRIKHKWTWKNYRDLLITILVIVVICLILWIFPPTNKLIMDFYNSNQVVKATVDVIGGILVGIWNSFSAFFSGEKIL